MGVLFSDTLEAKVSFSSVSEIGDFAVDSGVFWFGRGGNELCVVVEAEAEVEKGFTKELLDGLAPKSISPSLAGFFTASTGSDSGSFLFSFSGTSVTLTPRSARTLPSLRRHVLRLHENTYRRLSCPVKNSGRSP